MIHILFNRGFKRLLHQCKRTKHTKFFEVFHKNKHYFTNKVAYLSGLIDGEGYFKVEKTGTVRLVIGMCDREPIYWIHSNFGGNVALQKTAKGRRFYVWRMNQGKDLFHLILICIPFLKNKKLRAVKCLKDIITKFSKLEDTLCGYKYK